MDNQLEQNKATVIAFYDMAFNQNNPAEAVKRFTGDTYIQHNPGVKTGKEGFIEYFNQLAKEYPGKRVHFVRTIAEGSFVVCHTRQEWPGDQDWASMDIFRVDDQGKVVEHWDVIQRVPEDASNENTMF